MTELQPGDRIVALASCANGVAFLVGAVAAGITAWLAKHRVSVAALGAAVPTAIAVSALCALLLRVPILQGLWPALGAGALIGICWALLASLT